MFTFHTACYRSSSTRARADRELHSEDDCAEPARAGAGNLLCRLPGESSEWVMFCAHLDTVPHREPIEVVLHKP